MTREGWLRGGRRQRFPLIFEQWLLKFPETFYKLTKRPNFHDVACQGNLKFCQGIVREMSGNFVSFGVWQPCMCIRLKSAITGPLLLGQFLMHDCGCYKSFVMSKQ